MPAGVTAKPAGAEVIALLKIHVADMVYGSIAVADFAPVTPAGAVAIVRLKTLAACMEFGGNR